MSEPQQGDLTSRSVSGALWFFIQTIVIKASSLLAQIALAYILVPEDFGLIGMALSITAFADVLHQNGLSQVVVQRHLDLDREGRTVFWLSLAMGLAAMLVLVGIAPLAAGLFGQPEVSLLIMVLSIAVPINAAGAVPRAYLLEGLRFGQIATISGTQVVLQSALMVVFALLGLGAMSFALPMPIVAVITLFWYSRYRSLDAGWPPMFQQWRSLSKDTGVLMSTSWLGKVVEFGDYFLLGLFTTPTIVGLYFFAFRLSLQSANIVVNNVGRVMFPALAKLEAGSRRQLAAFTRASKAIAGVGVPLAILLVFFGPDLISVVFDPQWEDAAIFVQILSVAAVSRAAADSHIHLLKAQGRYGELFRWGLFGTIAFIGGVIVGGLAGGAIGVSLAVAAHAIGEGWIRYYLSVRPLGGGFWDLGRVLTGPLSASLISGALSIWLVTLAFGSDHSWARLVVGSGAHVLLYIPTLRLLDSTTHEILNDVRRRVTGASGKRAGKVHHSDNG